MFALDASNLNDVVGKVDEAFVAATTVLALGLAPQDDPQLTKLRFTEACFGHVTEAEMASKDHGWRYLYEGCMRAHLEGSEPPAWQDAPASSC